MTMNRTTVAAALCLGLMAASPAAASGGQSCTNSWKRAADGRWLDGANWTRGIPPAPADDACIVLGGSYEVTLDGDATVRSLTVDAGAAGKRALRLVGT